MAASHRHSRRMTTHTATSRPFSSGPGSSSASSVELPTLAGMNRNQPLPEEWTLPHEWKMEKRELFENWKMDVQNQIANIATSLNESLQTFPHPEVGRHFDYSDKVVEAEIEKRRKVESASRGSNTLLYGVARFPDTRQF
ncbi:uncharacterized protein LOC143292092 [Babylonia areolata]|uniref:uncharacterized protein LOC143292092 n=1 Tax=Babylonia areolata TaxID=304850 RepID=UPI003FD307E9